MARIVIAGGGIAGIACALAAARAGHEAVVLEQAGAFEEVGAGIQMGPNGRRALEALGAWDAVAASVVYPEGIRIRRARDGAGLGRLPARGAFEARFGSTYQLIHRADLLAGLIEAAQAQGGITLRTGFQVREYKTCHDSVMVESVTAENLSGDLLIGADGIRSTVRARLLADGPPVFAGHILYRALVDITSVPDMVDKANVNLWLHKGGHVVHYPVSGGRKFNIVAAVNESWDGKRLNEPSRADILRKVFADVAAPLRALLDIPDTWLRWIGADRKPAARWGAGPVTLAGDAAHPTLPYLASGAVMALEDAVVLGRELAQNADMEKALRTYETARQPRTARIVKSSHRLAAVYHAGNPLAFFRDRMIRLTFGAHGLERMAWLYSWRP